MELPPELASRPARKAGQEPTATLTLDAYNRLRAELEDLRTNGRSYIAERLRIAREHGDIRENADYDASKNDQALMESRIRTLERMLRDPDIVEAPVDVDTASPGMMITLRPLEEDGPEDETYLLAESAEERVPGARTITTTSPLGRAVTGKRVDDEIEYQAPGGTFHYRLVGLRPRE